mmetsp:Transcript_25210/g.45386  ORF Transcript_25210/g.45386 Transcript_25210/m.45386 type:complete len:272 (-) Transcript_25210:202-1017(-)|eukprot:CAMPEP_0201883520 /NCGR_PEP_ID=MMETSP0902-20130614/15895_1 /ASSEMBLY_ACC=CAM_ASM_000551 /TAXON_ID=420261 /ORGANISM="Thalassiosira antarctica, Strain CCMP982" /LENGTH=271 /DNA_ID=CAMNT_0048412333 /DNA_START=60 /DNA_END=875 /DNA_ORIENTATION=+
MLFHLTTSLLAGCAIQAAADAPAAITNNGAVSSPKTRDLLSTPTTDNNSNKKHRLLQKFKKRKQRELQNQRGGESDQADVGILSSKSDIPRFLQNDYDYYCPRESCPAELCNCADSGGSLEDCTDELQMVCRTGQLDKCVFSDYVQVYEEVYCPFVACVGEGFRENQCDCAFYELYCNRLEGAECVPFLQTSEDPDRKPFFGCDETELANVCSEATSCKGRGDLQGLPELGTWQGSVQTGIKVKSSGERVGGASVVAGVTLLSMLWLMVNV